MAFLPTQSSEASRIITIYHREDGVPGYRQMQSYLAQEGILTCHSCPTYKSNITILLAPFADCLKNMRKRFPALCQRIFHMRWNLIELLATNQSAVHSVSRLPTMAKSILVREPSKQSTSRCRTIPRSKSAPVTAKDSCAIMDRQPSLMIPHYWKNYWKNH